MSLKKTLVLMLVLLFTLGAMVGCGGKEKPEQPVDTEVVELNMEDLQEKLDDANRIYGETLDLVNEEIAKVETNETVEVEETIVEEVEEGVVENTEDVDATDGEVEEGVVENTEDVVENEDEQLVEEEVVQDNQYNEVLGRLGDLRAVIDEVETQVSQEAFEEQNEVDLAVVKINEVIEELREIKNTFQVIQQEIEITLINKLDKEITGLELALNNDTEFFINLIDGEPLDVDEQVELKLQAGSDDLLFVKVTTEEDSYIIMDIELTDGMEYNIE